MSFLGHWYFLDDFWGRGNGNLDLLLLLSLFVALILLGNRLVITVRVVGILFLVSEKLFLNIVVADYFRLVCVEFKILFGMVRIWLILTVVVVVVVPPADSQYFFYEKDKCERKCWYEKRPREMFLLVTISAVVRVVVMDFSLFEIIFKAFVGLW